MRNYSVLLLASLLCACTIPQQAAEISQSPSSALSATSTLSATPSPSSSPSATHTITLSPSSTSTETASPTPTESPTSTSTVTPTRPPPTSTPTLPPAPLYPNTPSQPWDRNAFLEAILAGHAAVKEFYDYFVILVGGQQGNCGAYWNYYGRWEGRPAFTDVPSNWYPLYYRYRVILANVRNVADPITQVCLRMGGKVSDEDDQAILAGLLVAISQFEQLYQEALARP